MGIFNKSSPWWTNLGTQLEEFKLTFLTDTQFGMPGTVGDNIFLRLIKTNHDTWIVATDGLSGYENAPGEFFVETTEELPDFNGIWPVALILEICKLIPKNAAVFTERLNEFGTITISVEITGAPPDWSLENAGGNIGLYLNLPHRYKTGKTNLINVKLLRPSELRYVLDEGKNGAREELRKRYETQGSATISWMERPPVI